MTSELEAFMRDYSTRFVGPLMYRYTRWVIEESKKRSIKRLYFLARDGYLLKLIAERICSELNLDIECRYLYCSRAALRMPSYNLIGEEAYDLLLLKGYYLTPKSILGRAELSDEEKEIIYKELNISEPERGLDENEFEEFIKLLRENQYYRSAVTEKSSAAYKPAMDYFKSEGLLDGEYVAIVDSGWTGSMQRSLRQLLDSVGYSGKIIGFYFGMFVAPKEEADGEYLTFYFNHKNGARRKTMFNNNVFECMLSANHGMTLRYGYEDGIPVPIFANNHSDEMLNLINSQIEGAIEYVSSLDTATLEKYDEKQFIKECYRISKRAMIYPTQEEALMYGRFTFCDDVTEGYRISLADKSMHKKLKNYVIFRKVIKKLTGKNNPLSDELFWAHGVVACLPFPKRLWYRLNILTWDWLKAILK